MKLLVLGASGIVGRRVCREVARLEGLESVVIAGRDGALLDRLVSALGHELFSSTTLDLHDSAALRAAMEEVDVVASAAGPAYALERDAVQAAIATGTNYVSLADDLPATEEVTALDEGATRAGVTVVSGCGMSPGLSNLLVALAAREGEPEEVAISLAASSADDTGPATAMHFLKMLDDPAPALSDGVDEVARGGTGPRLVYFPEPIGWVETFRSGHPEVLTLPTR
ncbi:MAG TPA: saccharopine dehydrogenase NADP-binding domain-containing protein, partial [Actinomycetota bacterium]|nr:saccharopine dehydrogenase NADP-binding domain-containing protein [Actinomycetota bacterium]